MRIQLWLSQSLCLILFGLAACGNNGGAASDVPSSAPAAASPMPGATSPEPASVTPGDGVSPGAAAGTDGTNEQGAAPAALAPASPAVTPANVPPGADPGVAAPERQLGAIGVQLYTLRAALEQDFEGTLRDVALLGYAEVEFAGLFGRDPAAVKQLLSELSLVPVASHVNWDRFRDDPDGVIEETLALGSPYLVFPYLPDTERQTLAQWQAWVALLNRVGQSCRERGLELVYHNHDFEFTPVEGVEPYTLLLDQLDPNLVRMELDLYWLAKAGREPDALFERFPGRFPLTHVKDMRRSDQAIVDVGQGDLDFAAVFAQAERSGMQHFIVEHDNAADPMQSVANSLTYLRQLRF